MTQLCEFTTGTEVDIKGTDGGKVKVDMAVRCGEKGFVVILDKVYKAQTISGGGEELGKGGWRVQNENFPYEECCKLIEKLHYPNEGEGVPLDDVSLESMSSTALDDRIDGAIQQGLDYLKNTSVSLSSDVDDQDRRSVELVLKNENREPVRFRVNDIANFDFNDLQDLANSVDTDADSTPGDPSATGLDEPSGAETVGSNREPRGFQMTKRFKSTSGTDDDRFNYENVLTTLLNKNGLFVISAADLVITNSIEGTFNVGFNIQP